MRRLLPILAVSIVLLAQPALADHGPCEETLDWCPGFGSRIEVVDTLASTVRDSRRDDWREARDTALARWEQAGVRFRVLEADDADYPPYPDPELDLVAAIIPGTVRLIRNPMPLVPGETVLDYALYDPARDGSFAAFSPFPEWWKPYYRPALIGLLTHEIGHTLGLWHRTDHGVMAGGWKPDRHDLAAVRRWYT